jgi:cell pole-organizing protein PopZ
MSKPQYASEPSMEEILSSIRKMISDDRPGPSPMPDQLGRMAFGEQSRHASPAQEPIGHPAASGGQTGGGSNFNSLADALKVATALSDQRRSLQSEIASVLEKGPRQADAANAASGLSPLADTGRAPAADPRGHRFPSFPEWRAEQVSAQPDGKRELMSFDFGTVVPQREEQSAKTQGAAEAKPVARPVTEGTPKADGADSESKAQPEEPRVLPMRTASGLNGSTAANVAPFPRPMRETAKPTADVQSTPAAETAPDKLSKNEAPATSADTAATAATEAPVAAGDASSAPAEALLDAVVDLVQQEPGALSVFTSGASFIGGVGAKKAVADAIASIGKTDASSATGAPPKMDRAAAELLRPMLRQWLADNMPRIVEDALRSELTETTQGAGKGPAKS